MTHDVQKEKSGEMDVPQEIGPLFLANFVHQVVNPLSGILGTLDNVIDGTLKGNAATQKTKACRAQLEQCVTLIRNLAYLSDYFFSVSGKESLRQPRADGVSILPQVVIEAAQFFQILAEKKHIRIECTDPINQYRLKVRPELFRQVFLNIFDNWLKYGLADYPVLVTPRVNSKKELVIEIKGNTIAFDNSDAERIFQLGYRSKQAINTVAQGSGIGLFICKQILENALDGRITAEHQVSKGETIFRIFVPKTKWQL